MQEEKSRRSNRERTDAMRAQLIEAARALFIQKGYADTGTPEIVELAGVTRGALYHHFDDKKALFRAVVDREFAAVAEAIEGSSTQDVPVMDALVLGGEAFLEAMSAPGRTRLLLLDGPAVLGPAEIDAICAPHGTRTLEVGIAMAMRDGKLPRTLPLKPITELLSAAYDRAALAIDAGADADAYRAALRALFDGLVRSR